VLTNLRVLDGLVVVGVLIGGSAGYTLLHDIGHPEAGVLDYVAALVQLALGASLALWALQRATRLRVTRAMDQQRGSPSV